MWNLALGALRLCKDPGFSSHFKAKRRRVRVGLACALIAAIASAAPRSASGQTEAPTEHDAWTTFRTRVPGHIQDWILSGSGPEYTLLYTEPPPRYTLDEYGALLKSVFRGYKGCTVRHRDLGYNGRLSDLVVDLDYSVYKDDPLAALQQDLAVLSTRLYGTAVGARFVRPEEIPDSDKRRFPDQEIVASAVELETWLFDEHKAAMFSSPETGASGELAALTAKGLSGRFLSDDNSLVALIVQHDAGVDAQLLPQIRAFTIDSDLILGGVVDQRCTTLLGRSRRLLLTTFPPLRVEDVVNAMTTKDSHWAQSYDRNTPGAGRARLPDGKEEDWAPSFLSADLVDTEFGSLLNYADAVLKSQSLSGVVSYRGFRITRMPNPPYTEGVYEHLRQRINQSSLVFNFNTVGVGHWLESFNRRIYALNSTGSFSVTYSPDTTGYSSMLERAAAIEEAQARYTQWFAAQQNPELRRTVQYMAIYQLFGKSGVKGPRLYGDTAKFAEVGRRLKEALRTGATDALAGLGGSDEQKLERIQQSRRRLAGPTVSLQPMPKTIDDLLKSIADAAIAVRYDGNLFGSRLAVLEERRATTAIQHNRAYAKIESDYARLVALEKRFAETYRRYKVGDERKIVNGKIVQFTNYQVPKEIEASYHADEAKISSLWSVVEPVLAYCDRLASEADQIKKEIADTESDYMSRGLLLDAVAKLAKEKDPTAFTTRVLNTYAASTEPDSFPQSRFAIVTPTVVVSVAKANLAGRFTGGHNVELQSFRVVRDAALTSKQFTLNDGVLRISPDDAPMLGALSQRMAGVANADPAAQRRVFESVLKDAKPAELPRHQRLALDPPVAGTGSVSGANREAAYALAADGADAGTRPVLGRDAQTGRLYVDQAVPDGGRTRSIVFGSTSFPEIIDRMTAQQQAVDVVLDPSLRASDIEAIVTNYKNAGRGGGEGSPAGRWVTSRNAEGDGPRLVSFVDSRSGRSRVVVKTAEGRVELIVPKEQNAEALLGALKTEIKRGATLTLETAKAGLSEGGRELLLVGFQSQPVKGKLAARGEAGGGLLQQGTAWFSDLLSRSFARVQQRQSGANTAADFIISVQRDAGLQMPAWKTEIFMEVGERGIRFVIKPSRETGTMGPPAADGVPG